MTTEKSHAHADVPYLVRLAVDSLDKSNHREQLATLRTFSPQGLKPSNVNVHCSLRFIERQNSQLGMTEQRHGLPLYSLSAPDEVATSYLRPNETARPWHPKLTPYHLSLLSATFILGIAKAIATQQGRSLASTTLEWVGGTVLSIMCVIFLFALLRLCYLFSRF